MAGTTDQTQLVGYIGLVDSRETPAYLKILDGKLDLILDRILSLTEQENAMSAEVDRIKASVAGLTSISHSAITLLAELGSEIRARQDDPAALTALANEIDQRKQELAAAITANTQLPPTPPTPTTPPTNPPTPGTPTTPTTPTTPATGGTSGGTPGTPTTPTTPTTPGTPTTPTAGAAPGGAGGAGQASAAGAGSTAKGGK